MIVQTILNGALVGGLGGLLALGLSLTFGVLKMINLAHGEFIIGGAYLIYTLTEIVGLPLWLSVIIVVAFCAAFGYALQRGLFTTLLRRGPDGPFVATFGLSMLLQGVFLEVWTSQAHTVSSQLSLSAVSIFGVRLLSANLVVFIVALALTVAIYLVLNRSRIGAAVRAAAADPVTASTQGIDVNRMFAWVMACSAAIAALSGLFIAISYGFAPTAGAPWLMMGMVIVVLGGVGNVWGTFFAGIIIGIVQSLSAEIWGGGAGTIALYVVFLLVLAVRPQGIFSSKVA